MKKEKSNKKNEMQEQKKETLFDRMPQEFKNLIHDYACGKYITAGPEHFINYVYDHREDYKDSNSGITAEGTLLMVQELFENPTGSPINLFDYMDRDLQKHTEKIGIILREVVSILEELERAGRLPQHRGGDVEDEDLGALTQNMHLYLYIYFRHMNWKEGQKHELDEIVVASINNMKWVLSFDDSAAKNLLERDFWFNSAELDFHRGCKPFEEPLFALISEEPYEEESLEAYERYYYAIEEMASTVKAKESYKRLLIDAQKELDKLYTCQWERIDDDLEMLQEEMVELVMQRRAIHEKQLKLQNKKITQDIFGDVADLPF